MPTADGKLKTTEVPMSPEEWEVNKSCELKKREHKFYWKPGSDTIGYCAHCGKEEILSRKGEARGVTH